MRQWTRQQGHPLVTVHVTDTQIKLKQSRFLLDSMASKVENLEWYIPFTYSIEKIASNGNSPTNQANIENLYDKIYWFAIYLTNR